MSETKVSIGEASEPTKKKQKTQNSSQKTENISQAKPIVHRHVVLIQCTDAAGLIAKIARCIFLHKFNIIKNQEYVGSGRFYMRTEIEGAEETGDLIKDLKMTIPEDSVLVVSKPKVKKEIVILCTKEPYCLGDLLITVNYAASALNANIKAVISNHDTLRGLVEKFNHPFHHVPCPKGLSRSDHETQILKIMEDYNPDYVVLAKYMRILTNTFIKPLHHKIINIHHSFLPAFIGANPYKQAFQRGVKIIGATAHFVTEELDDGPIIAQSVHNVNHSMSWQQMARAGRDCEKITLAKALRLVFDDRVFVSANRTIILTE